MADEIKQRTVYVLTRKNKADDDDSDIYVGSTSQPLWRRFADHRKDAKWSINRNNKLYKRMYEVGLQNWEILPLLGRTCGKKEAFELEKKWIRVLGAGLNTYLPVTDKVNREADLQRVAKYQKKYKECKRFYCGVCDLACKDKYNLNRHLDTLKHSYAWLNSLD